MFFYPKAMTPGCTTESCNFRDTYEEFMAAGYDIVGVSPDKPSLNKRFKERKVSTSTCSPMWTTRSLKVWVLGGKRRITARCSKG